MMDGVFGQSILFWFHMWYCRNWIRRFAFRTSVEPPRNWNVYQRPAPAWICSSCQTSKIRRCSNLNYSTLLNPKPVLNWANCEDDDDALLWSVIEIRKSKEPWKNTVFLLLYIWSTLDTSKRVLKRCSSEERGHSTSNCSGHFCCVFLSGYFLSMLENYSIFFHMTNSLSRRRRTRTRNCNWF